MIAVPNSIFSFDIATTNNTQDVSKLVSSGTSSSKSGGIDKDDIYSSDKSGTRHLERVQETITTTDDGEKDISS
ncbi:MAG TPA: hypothetical protein VJ729_15995 [Nitrososphaeraceae archaeon]|nr:hypothetical protein [Nitrososphaeraceae archaeon]